MNLLLDTHIWIWNHLAPEKISSEVNGILADSENELWLSPVSVWELIMLVEKKRLELERDLHDWVQQSKMELALKEAPLSWEVADELRFTILRQRDPADRFLVATARVYDLTLVTADQHLLSVPGLKVLQNRCEPI
jgi:PIN domain nuclease of toxin-antitoxin system